MIPSAGRRPERLGGALEVVDGLEQVAGQGADGVDAVGVGLLLGPLLIVGELGAAAQELVAELVALLLQLRRDPRSPHGRVPAARGVRPPSGPASGWSWDSSALIDRVDLVRHDSRSPG